MGYSLHMSMMKDLIKNIYEDIIKENWYEILTSNWKLDLQKVKKLIAPRTRSVLQQIIINNSLK